MRVLIAGCGYVGLPLGRKLAGLGHQVFGLRRSALAAAEMEAAGITPLHADITRPETLAGLPGPFDWVVNCAASGGGGAEDYRRIYLEGNRNLLNWLAGTPPQKFVYTSSTSVYGQNDGSLVTEESPTEPDAPTAQVLVEAEKILLDASCRPEEGQPHGGFPAVILRVAGIYGPGRGHGFKAFLRNEARIEGDGSRWLNMIHRDDLIGVILAALAGAKAGSIFNVADQEPVSQRAFYEWLAGELQRPLPPTVPADADTWRRRGVTNKRVSSARLRSELNYEFLFPDFRAGYRAEIEQLRLAAPL